MDWIAELTARIKTEYPDALLRPGAPLSGYTSFRIGGPAALLALPRSIEQLVGMRRLAAACQAPVLVLGAGTNVLAPDEGLDALVLCTREGLTEVEAVDETHLRAQCGAPLAKVAVMAQQMGLSGLEFAHGIPGTVGGGVLMNAGAYGGEIRDVAVCTRVLRADGAIETVEGADQGFGYRHSAFEQMDAVILETTFALKPADPAEILEKMQQLRKKRAASQPLEYPSAGSTFKRPETGFAAALIDQAGLKGLSVGGAQVSEKHAGFVINRGGATAADVLALMEQIAARVRAASGVHLEPEVRILQVQKEA